MSILQNGDLGSKYDEFYQESQKLISDMADALEVGEYYDTPSFVCHNILNSWANNKSWLIKIMRKSKFWDEEAKAIVMTCKDVREKSIAEKTDAVSCFIHNLDIYPRSARFMLSSIKSDIAAGYKVVSVFCAKEVNDEAILYNVKSPLIKSGEKITRAIRKICVAFGIDKFTNYEKEFATLADIINDLKIDRKFILSVHPCDYLLMSNGNSWSSCHMIASGNNDKCYQSGTISYLMDECSMIFYMVDKDCKLPYWKEEKIKRQMFSYGNGALLQSRLYPTENKNTSSEIRAVVQKCLADCLEENNLWQLAKDETEYHHYFETDCQSTHYKDYEYNASYHITFSNLKSLMGEIPSCRAVIGQEPICVECGDRHTNTEDLRCKTCANNYDYYCDRCETGLYEHDDYIVTKDTGNIFCMDCVDSLYYCEGCGEYFEYDDLIVASDTENIFCAGCAESLYYCEGCGECFEDGVNIIDTDYGYYCNDCYDKYHAEDEEDCEEKE